MATSTANLVCDGSTLANYKSWCQFISNGLATCGWTQTNDTGQVNWTSTVVAISANTHSGSNNTYTYTLTSGPALRVGMSIVITGMTNAGNNGTYTITALGAGTFTVVDAGGVTEAGSAGTGTTTAIASVSTVYEIWQATDALAATLPIIMKIQYSANVTITITVGTSSNGTGTITGSNNGGIQITSANTNQGSTLFPCYLSGDTGRFCFYMWGSFSAFVQSVFSVERSKNSSGSDTADYINVSNASSGSQNATQQAIYPTTLTPREGSIISFCNSSAVSTGYWNGSTAVFPQFPMIGKVGNPILGFALADSTDVGTFSTVTITSFYGGSHNYITTATPSTNNWNAGIGGSRNSGATPSLLMRYE